MNTEIVRPNLSSFIKSLRDVGYTFEIAVADVLDNSITARSSAVKIYAAPNPELIFALLDDGSGMLEAELVEAMRMASKDPEVQRSAADLGRFGLGLKTASFSQCRKLTVITKKDEQLAARQWDLDFISQNNEWVLLTPDSAVWENLPLTGELIKQKSGTLVIWQSIDKLKQENFTDEIDRLRKHLALVFHRFLEGSAGVKPLKIFVNNNPVKPFNPFNTAHPATQQGTPEKIKIFNSVITIQPYILPHHSKLSQQEYEQYATEDGYTKSQGFYLYRSDRLLIHGTWWGLHKTADAHQLVRVKIDISNDQDGLWAIDIKKSAAKPLPEIKSDLLRIIGQATERGVRLYAGRGRRIEDKTVQRFWEIIPIGGDLRFSLNAAHPLYEKLFEVCSDKEILAAYLKGVQAYLPLEAIQAHLQQNPHRIKQEEIFTEADLAELAAKLQSSILDADFLEHLLKTELFKNRKELFFDDGNK